HENRGDTQPRGPLNVLDHRRVAGIGHREHDVPVVEGNGEDACSAHEVDAELFDGRRRVGNVGRFDQFHAVHAREHGQQVFFGEEAEVDEHAIDALALLGGKAADLAQV